MGCLRLSYHSTQGALEQVPIFHLHPLGKNGSAKKKRVSYYTFGYNGMEKDPEMKGEGNSYTTEFRQYDPRLGRWMSRDPKVLPAESPFMAMGDNPIYFTDILGDIVKAGNRSSASHLLAGIKNAFQGTEAFNLFELESDGLTLKKITAKDFAKAVQSIKNQDQRDLAYAYYLAINATETHEVFMINSTDATSQPYQDGNRTFNTGAELLERGGGVNNAAANNGSKTEIVMDQVGVYDNSEDRISELLAHEMLGHGYGRSHRSSKSDHEDAVQMSNLARRTFGIQVFRDGADHKQNGGLSPAVYNAVPNMFGGVNRFVAKNTTNYQHIGTGTEHHIKFDSNKAEKTTGKYRKVKDIISGKDYEVFRDKKTGDWHFKDGPKDK